MYVKREAMNDGKEFHLPLANISFNASSSERLEYIPVIASTLCQKYCLSNLQTQQLLMSSRCSLSCSLFLSHEGFVPSVQKPRGYNRTEQVSYKADCSLVFISNQWMTMLASYMGWWYRSVTTMVLSACSWFAKVLPRHTTPCGAHDSAFLRRLHQSDAPVF